MRIFNIKRYLLNPQIAKKKIYFEFKKKKTEIELKPYSNPKPAISRKKS